MTFTLTFSTIQDGQRKPLLNAGQEVTLTVEADSKTATYTSAAVTEFCNTQGNDCRIRRVS